VGLLVVSSLLAVGLALTGFLSRQRAETTAKQALEGRALDLALGAASALALVRPRDRQAMESTVEALAVEPIRSVALVSGRGRVLFASDEKGRAPEPLSDAVREVLASQGKHLVEPKRGTENVFVVWLPVRSRGRGRGRWHRWWRMHGRGRGGPWLPPSRRLGGGGRKRAPGGADRDEEDSTTGRWGRRGRGLGRSGGRGMGMGMGMGRQPIFLRVETEVEAGSISASVAQARVSQYLSLGGAFVLIVVSLLLFGSHRRTAKMRADMERQRSLAEMGEMAAVLAHEIRNPLGVIKGTAQMLLERDEPGDAGSETKRQATSAPTSRRELSQLVEQTGRLEKLVGGLLDYARPAPLELEWVDGEELASQAVSFLSAEAVGREVAVIADLEPCAVEADRGQALQVLLNILKNGIEASPRKSSVTFRLYKRSGKARFEVIDSGEGLPGQLGEDIFRPFVTTKTDGTGLGLPISRRIAEAHGGRLWAEDVADRGAKLVFELPRCR
jgi:signal transduction histidine kinase